MLGDWDAVIRDTTRALKYRKWALPYFRRGLAWHNKGEYDKAIADYTRAIELKPDDAVDYNNRGNAWRSKGEYDKAIADYIRAIELDAGYTAAYTNRALTLVKQGKFDRARADFEKALSIPAKYDNGKWAHDTARKHLAEMKSGFFACRKMNGQKAIDACTRFLEREKDDEQKRAWAHFFRGWEYRRVNEVDKAIADLERAIAIDPKFEKAYKELVAIWRSRNKPEKVLAVLENQTIANPSSSAAWEALADLQMQLKKYEQAARNYRRAASVAQKARRKRDMLIYLGHAYLKLNDAAKLHQSVEEVLKMSPYKPDFHALHHRAWAFLIEENIPAARKQLLEIIRLTREQPEVFEAVRFRKLASARLRDAPRHFTAWKHFKAGRFTQALEGINAFLKKHPDDVEALRFRSEVHEKLKQPEKALTDLDQITILRPQDPEAWKALAEGYYRQKKIAQAIRNISRAIALKPDNAAYLNARAWYHVLDGQGEKGVEDIAKALKLRPNTFVFIDTHAHVLAALGKDDAARAEFEKVFAGGVKTALSHLAYARLMLKKDEKEKARAYLRQAVKLEAKTWEDREARETARRMLEQLAGPEDATPAQALDERK